MYREINGTWQQIWREGRELLASRLMRWRREPAITRVKKPTRLDRARKLGYKAKQGFVVVRVRVGRGAMRRPKPRAGRRPKARGTTKRRVAIDVVGVAIHRARKRYPNLKPLGGYLLYEDGKYRYVELIFVDPNHPGIKADKELARRL